MRQQTLVSPGPDLDWAAWASGASGAGEELRLVRKGPDPAAAAGPAARVIVALPISESLTFAFWLPHAEAELYEPMVLSQLEKRGLASRSGAVFDYAVIAQEEGRALVRVTVLPGSFPASLSFSKAHRYVVSADVFPLPENRITLWRERDALVLVATRGERLVYTQVLDHGEQAALADVAREVAVIRMALEMEEVVEAFEGVTLWEAFPEWRGDDGKAFDWEKALGLPVEVAPIPLPSAGHIELASGRSKLLPIPLQDAQLARLRRHRFVRFGAMAGIGYVGLVFLLWVYLHSLQSKSERMGAAITRDKPAAAALEKTAASWRAIEPAVNPNLYIIEQFYQCSSVLPEVGIRLNVFEANGPFIRIKGTGRNAPEIYRYVRELRKSRRLAGYRWNVAPPKLKQDDSADFQIEGKLTTYGSSK